MSLLNKLTIKNLKLNKKRTIVTIIGIILSVALITAVASMYSSLISSLIIFETKEKGNFHVAFYDVAKSDLEIFQNNQQAEDFYLTENIGYALYPGIVNVNKPYLFIKGFDNKSLENLSIKLVEGKLPEKSDEIVVPTHLKTNGRVDLKVGDTLTLEVGTRVDNAGNVLNQDTPYLVSEEEESLEKIIKTTTKTYKIVGIIERPANNIEAYSAPGYTLITYSDFNEASRVDVYTHLTKKGVRNYVTYTAGILGIDPEIFKNYVDVSSGYEAFMQAQEAVNNAPYKININDYLIDLQTNPFNNESIGSLGAVVVIVCLIIVFTSVFCIKNSFDISITEKIKQYGMLRSIGATKKQIKRNVFYEGTVLGLIGIPLGVLSGLLASYILVWVCNYFLAGSLDESLTIIFATSPLAIIIAVLLGIVTIYFSVLRSASRAAKVNPIDSIRNSANIKINKKKVKSNSLVTKLFGVGGDLSYKNLKRNRKKYRTTIISIITSVAVFIALSAFMNMAFDSVHNELSLQNFNISMVSLSLNEKIKSKITEIEQLPSIDNYTVERDSDVTLMNPRYNKDFLEKIKYEPQEEEENIRIVAIGEVPFQRYLQKLGLNYDAVKDKGILYDKVNYVSMDEEGSTHSYRIREFAYTKGDVVNISDNSIELALVTDELPIGPYEGTSEDTIFVSDAYFDKYYQDAYINIYIMASNANECQDEIDKIFQGEEYYLNNSAENAQIMQNLFTLIGIFLYGFIIVISLIGITNIFNTITTSMELRRGEFAMLKSVGMTTPEFRRMIRLESIFIGLKSLIWGIPIGIILSYLIYRTGDMDYAYKLPILAIILSIVAVYLLITLIMSYSLKKIKKQNTIETIRNENI